MIDGVSHIGIAVLSIDSALPFWEALGLEVSEIEVVPEDGVRVAMIPCGSVRIELLEPLDDASPVAKFLARRGPGIHHLCLDTNAVDRDSEALRQKGYRVIRDQPTRGAGGCRVQFVHPKSTGGVLLELAEPPAGPPAES